MVRVAAVQMSSAADTAGNLAVAGELIAEAAGSGARLVVLPEMVNRLGPGPVLRAGAEPFDGPTTRWASEQASRHHVWLVAGSFIEQRVDGGRSNTSVVASPSGDLAATYRKVHLFDCAVPGAEFRESDVTDPGDELVVVSLAGLDGGEQPDGGPILGMSICYDLRFPELYRALAVAGATILAVPAAFTAHTGPPHWEVLLRARAIENQCFVMAAGQAGETAPGLAWHGHSMIVDPWGVVLAETTGSLPEVITADLDLDRLVEVRAELPSLASRRPATYDRVMRA